MRAALFGNSKSGKAKVPNKLGKAMGDSGAGSDVSDGAMRVRLKSALGPDVVSHLLSDSGVHSRVPAASFFPFLSSQLLLLTDQTLRNVWAESNPYRSMADQVKSID